MPHSVKAGTQRSVTSATTPSAPEPDARCAKQFGVTLGGARRASSHRQARASAPPPARGCCASERPSRGWQSISPPRCSARRCRPRFSSARPCSARLGIQLCDRDATLHAHETRVAIHVEHTLKAVEHDQHPVAAGDVAEGVSRARGAHTQAVARGATHRGRDLLDRSGMHDLPRPAAFVAGPVAPLHVACLRGVRLAHQMTASEPTASQARRPPRMVPGRGRPTRRRRPKRRPRRPFPWRPPAGVPYRVLLPVVRP